MKAITFKQFMLTYNFRYYREDCNEPSNRDNTQCIRIRYPLGDEFHRDYEWFEFGMYDYAGNSYKLQQLNHVFSKNILDMYVCGFSYDEDLEIFVVTLDKDEYIDEVE